MTIDNATLIQQFLTGPETLRTACAGLSMAQLATPATPGRWSIQQVVCHVSDFEIVSADRIKRVLAEERPTLFGGDPDLFAARLAYNQRAVEDELQLISAIRRQVGTILQQTTPADWERIGLHSEAGPLTLRQLLERVTGHIPHHLQFITAKRVTLSAAG